MSPRPPRSTLFPYTTLFRSDFATTSRPEVSRSSRWTMPGRSGSPPAAPRAASACDSVPVARSEEHTSELQSLRHLVCRLLLEKKKQKKYNNKTKHIKHIKQT